MSTILTRKPSKADAHTADRATQARMVVAAGAERRDPLRRRWGRVGGGVLAAVLGGWGAASLYLSADDRDDVVALADGVGRGEVVERSDLRVVRISSDTDVASVPAGRLDELVGRVAGSDLAAGSLLAEDQLVDDGERLVLPSEATVGVLVGANEAPTPGLVRGAAVSVVVRPPAGATGGVTAVSGWVADAGSTESSTGDRPIAVVVPAGDAPMVSAAAADGRVSLVVVGG